METALLAIQLKLKSLWFYLYTPWTVYQVAIVVACFLLARSAARLIEPRMEEWARTIKGNPDLLRVLAALMRRLTWVFFIPMAWVSAILIRQYTWPSRAWIVDVSVKLAAAWLIIAVLSRIIRSRFFARTVTIVGWSIAALSLTNTFGTVMLALDSFAFNLGEFRLSAFAVIKGIVLLVGLIWLASLLGNFVDARIQRVEDLTPSLRVLTGKVVKITLMIVAVAAALSAIGLDLTALTVFSGAVGVGIGFGLQKVVSNFISGIIILLDKSIKPGDTISLGETFGWIRELRARFVSVVTRDGKEFLIPNEDFITQQVVNWSFSDDLVRLDVPFGVSYDSDPHEVTRVALSCLEDLDRVSKLKKPVCWMTEFGDSSINFVLRFWIRDPQNGLTNIRGTVLLSLWDKLKEADIAIPFPHREVIFRTPLEVASSGQKNAPRPQPRRKSAAKGDT
ncbi:mechanosensitive ion channel family protein [Salaquimonas pukyongi]|uniref:mechanosensitive ion channel family protein n=1 Tax=Salaquimonas pukyongi TaxID=2712698 RepID=UPI00096B7670|nr:mechanosensitive ion channel domain-containing protein [Salaquimonas pukyongi]